MSPVIQNINAPVYGHVAGGDIHHHTHHHSHTLHAHGPVHLHVESPAFALQAPPAPQARYRQRNKQVVQPITPPQKDLLALMRPLPKPVRNGLLEWMRNEFGTGLVMELDLLELQLARQRVLDARRAAGI